MMIITITGPVVYDRRFSISNAFRTQRRRSFVGKHSASAVSKVDAAIYRPEKNVHTTK